jgi:hypothetical protein
LLPTVPALTHIIVLLQQRRQTIGQLNPRAAAKPTLLQHLAGDCLLTSSPQFTAPIFGWLNLSQAQIPIQQLLF